MPPPANRLEVDDVGGRDGGGVDERGGAVRRLRARRVVGDERGPLLGQPHELVRRVVEAGVHAVLEVGRRRDQLRAPVGVAVKRKGVVSV